MAIKSISIIIVIMVLILPVMTLTQVISFEQMKLYMLFGSIAWFVLAPFWIKKEK